MYPKIDASPLRETQIALLPSSAIVYDLIYTPRPTQLLTLAKQQKLHVLDGLEMLIQQGAVGFEMWTGNAPSIDVMRQAALNVLEARDPR
jgi:shikimate dehydrogenase